MAQKIRIFAVLVSVILLSVIQLHAWQGIQGKRNQFQLDYFRCKVNCNQNDKKDMHFTKQASGSNNQLGIDISPVLALSLSFARKSQRDKFYGCAIGVAWEENANTFHKNICNVLHGDLFLRYQSSNYFHFGIGVSALGFSPHDDDDRRGFFFGSYVAPAIGYRFVFFAPRARIGFANDYRGSEFGIILSPLVLRIVIPW